MRDLRVVQPGLLPYWRRFTWTCPTRATVLWHFWCSQYLTSRTLILWQYHRRVLKTISKGLQGCTGADSVPQWNRQKHKTCKGKMGLLVRAMFVYWWWWVVAWVREVCERISTWFGKAGVEREREGHSMWFGGEQLWSVVWGLVFEEAESSLVLPLRLSVAYLTGWYMRPLQRLGLLQCSYKGMVTQVF
jgi:hypothetical protein